MNLPNLLRCALATATHSRVPLYIGRKDAAGISALSSTLSLSSVKRVDGDVVA